MGDKYVTEFFGKSLLQNASALIRQTSKQAVNHSTPEDTAKSYVFAKDDGGVILGQGDGDGISYGLVCIHLTRFSSTQNVIGR
jgi:hypothetical protein